MLKKIGDSIKKVVPFEAVMPTESITPPVVGDQADCNKHNTCHVDEFLYDEDQVEVLIKKGKLKRYYCLDCNSRNIQVIITIYHLFILYGLLLYIIFSLQKLTFISHSMSRQTLQYIFKVLLPKDLEDKQLLDIGSRLGTVLYAVSFISIMFVIYEKCIV